MDIELKNIEEIQELMKDELIDFHCKSKIWLANQNEYEITIPPMLFRLVLKIDGETCKVVLRTLPEGHKKQFMRNLLLLKSML